MNPVRPRVARILCTQLTINATFELIQQDQYDDELAEFWNDFAAQLGVYNKFADESTVGGQGRLRRMHRSCLRKRQPAGP